MKKITLLLAFIGMITLNGCQVNEPAPIQNDEDTIAEVFDIKGVNFVLDSNNEYTIFRNLTPNIFASDNILIYRLSGTINPTTPIWQLIPRTLYLPQGELDYDFDFSKQDFTIYAGGNYNIALTPSYINNQTFRIVIIPGAFSNRMSKPIDFQNYNEVANFYNIVESKVKVRQ